jgi:hypothetical protein
VHARESKHSITELYPQPLYVFFNKKLTHPSTGKIARKDEKSLMYNFATSAGDKLGKH